MLAPVAGPRFGYLSWGPVSCTEHEFLIISSCSKHLKILLGVSTIEWGTWVPKILAISTGISQVLSISSGGKQMEFRSFHNIPATDFASENRWRHSRIDSRVLQAILYGQLHELIVN